MPADRPPAATDASVDGVLHDVFGFTEFRPNQREIVEAVLAGRDVFAVMPTGGGKSLCYQLPARLLPGTCVVISPLIALMKDQVDAARANGLAAACLNSSQSGEERAATQEDLRAGRLDLLYVAPERLAAGGFLNSLKSLDLAFFAIDEAHCISEWGHDFRPDYLQLSRLAEEFPGTPIAAFTATATEQVADDIRRKLGLRDPFQIRASFNRKNLFYQITPRDKAHGQILDFLRERQGQSGIIYRTSRKNVENTAAFLSENGIPALPYHAGLESDVRARNQEQFVRDEVPVIVATIALGMGIDKPNVRYVIHADLPKNPEGYYQETGRAGRDGDPAHCLLLYSAGDVSKQMHFIREIPGEEERANAERLLWSMVGMASLHGCRRKRLLAYFGEELEEENCGGCDICTGDAETVDATRDAQMLMSAVVRTGQRFGINHVIDVVTGANTEKIRQFGHDEIKTYGVGKDQPKGHWRFILDNLLGAGALVQVADPYPHLELTEKGDGILRRGETFEVLRQKKSRTRERRAAAAPSGPYDQELFATLKELRTALAQEEGVPPYIIFSDRSLREMAAAWPKDEASMLAVHGVGQSKMERYGAKFLEAIRAAG